jgi:hypothetical protein
MKRFTQGIARFYYSLRDQRPVMMMVIELVLTAASLVPLKVITATLKFLSHHP